MAGFISEWWPESNRNGGRHQIGIPGRIASEFAVLLYTVFVAPMSYSGLFYLSVARIHFYVPDHEQFLRIAYMTFSSRLYLYAAR